MSIVAFWICVLLASSGLALICFLCLSKLNFGKNRGSWYVVLGMIAVVLMFCSFIRLSQIAPNGMAIDRLSPEKVYQKKWAHLIETEKGFSILAKLVVGEGEAAEYYEIPMSKFPYWRGELDPFPPKFKVTMDVKGENYILIIPVQ